MEKEKENESTDYTNYTDERRNDEIHGLHRLHGCKKKQLNNVFQQADP